MTLYTSDYITIILSILFIIYLIIELKQNNWSIEAVLFEEDQNEWRNIDHIIIEIMDKKPDIAAQELKEAKRTATA